MPDEPWLWALAVVVVGAVVVVALIKGGAVEVSLDPPSLKFRRKAQKTRTRTSVLEKAEIENSEIGDVTGERLGENEAQTGEKTVEVGKDLKVKGSKIGDITGVSVSGSSETKGPDKSDD